MRGLPRHEQFFVYIMGSYRGVLYTGVTNDLIYRVAQHRQKVFEGFTKKYNVTHLLYYEVTGSSEAAIAREKQIKGWRRSKKVMLIEAMNPKWQDLADQIS